MISLFPKSKALKSYVLILPHFLKKAYGKKKQYSKGQILDAIKQTSLNQKYQNYALALFMFKKSFEALEVKLWESPGRAEGLPIIIKNSGRYSQLRKEVAKKFFKGNELFKIHDLLSLSNIHMKKGKVFDPADISISALGDSVQDYYDADGD
jgi:hypothetical protein